MSVLSDSMCQVSSDSMLIVSCQVSGVRYQVLEIRCQVYTYQRQVINMSVSGELNTELQHHISGNHLVM